jgi:hypothetical protein
MTGPDDYPEAWKPRERRERDEALMLALDSYIAALSPEEFDQLVQRTRG